jgi:hypothetical protein
MRGLPVMATKDMTAGTEQPGHDRQGRTARTKPAGQNGRQKEQLGQDRQERTAGNRQQGQDRQERTAKPGLNCQNWIARHCSQKRTARRGFFFASQLNNTFFICLYQVTFFTNNFLARRSKKIPLTVLLQKGGCQLRNIFASLRFP